MNNNKLNSHIRSSIALTLISGIAVLLFACGGGGSSTPTYTIGGSVTGTSGTGLTLQLNAANNLSIAADGNYSFTKTLTSNSSYAVTVISSPAGQTCHVSNAGGNVASANISNANVECRTNANPNGYYTNTSTSVGDGAAGTLSLTDFQAIVQDNRFIAMSVAQNLVYDGPLEMFGNDFTATVSVYHEGVMIYSNVSVSGSVIVGSSISGTFAGTQQGAGTFGLVFASSNSSTASVSRIESTMSNSEWGSHIGGSTTNELFLLDSTGSIGADTAPSDGNLAGCYIASVSSNVLAVSAISGTNLYRITVQLGSCTNTTQRTLNAGNYTGFATSRTDSTADDTLVFMVTSANGQYTASGDFK